MTALTSTHGSRQGRSGAGSYSAPKEGRMGVEKCYKTINRQGDVGICKGWLWMSYALIWVLATSLPGTWRGGAPAARQERRVSRKAGATGGLVSRRGAGGEGKSVRCSELRSVRTASIFKVAGGPGFEPGLTESESAVLPLNYPPPDTLVTRAHAARFGKAGGRVANPAANAGDIASHSGAVYPPVPPMWIFRRKALSRPLGPWGAPLAVII